MTHLNPGDLRKSHRSHAKFQLSACPASDACVYSDGRHADGDVRIRVMQAMARQPLKLNWILMLVTAVLAGELGPQRDLVLVNAAGALWIADAAPDLASGLALAAQSVDSGAARAKLAALVERTQR